MQYYSYYSDYRVSLIVARYLIAKKIERNVIELQSLSCSDVASIGVVAKEENCIERRGIGQWPNVGLHTQNGQFKLWCQCCIKRIRS